jgi:RNA polymerase sigma-B factor
VEGPIVSDHRRLEELELQLDHWEATDTLPVRAGPRRFATASAQMWPAVDPTVWFMHVRYYHRRRPEVRERLVVEYEGHARQLARRFYRHREPLEDLVQVAVEGLIRALDRFDPRRRVPFLGFAKPTIVGTLKRHYRDTGWALRVPRRIHDISASIGPAVDALSQDLGRPPTPAEVADLLDLPAGDVESALAAGDARNVASVDAPGAPPDGSGFVGTDDTDLRRAENRIALDQALALLTDADRAVLHRYLVLEMSQEEIARELGVSQMQVSRVINRILRRLRSHLAP